MHLLRPEASRKPRRRSGAEHSSPSRFWCCRVRARSGRLFLEGRRGPPPSGVRHMLLWRGLNVVPAGAATVAVQAARVPQPRHAPPVSRHGAVRGCHGSRGCLGRVYGQSEIIIPAAYPRSRTWRVLPLLDLSPVGSGWWEADGATRLPTAIRVGFVLASGHAHTARRARRPSAQAARRLALRLRCRCPGPGLPNKATRASTR